MLRLTEALDEQMKTTGKTVANCKTQFKKYVATDFGRLAR